MTKSAYELADIGTRLVALIIDNIALGLIGALLSPNTGAVGWGFSFLLGLVYHWYFLTRQNGQTPGKRIMNLRVIKTDGSALSDSDAVLRVVGYAVNSLIFGLGWLIALFDANRQGLHDKLASTYVIKV